MNIYPRAGAERRARVLIPPGDINNTREWKWQIKVPRHYVNYCLKEFFLFESDCFYSMGTWIHMHTLELSCDHVTTPVGVWEVNIVYIREVPILKNVTDRIVSILKTLFLISCMSGISGFDCI